MSEGNGSLRAEHEELRSKHESFEDFVRAELKHLRECAKDTGKAVDELLRLAKLEEQRHEAEHG